MNQNNLLLLKNFIGYCKVELNIETLPKISLVKDSRYVLEYRSFGEYNPATRTVRVYYPGRNFADVCRSLAHELCHHRQNELGMLDTGAGETGSEIENDANAMAGIIMRDYGKINPAIYDIPEVESLNERKQVGNLYHFTNYAKMIGIIEDNFVLKSTIQPYVSFTRNKDLVSDTISQSVRMTVDGTKLTDKYSITPHADTKGGYGRTVSNRVGAKLTGDESEERISLEKYPQGVDISKSLIKVSVKKMTVDFDYENPDEFEFVTEPPSLEQYNKLIKLLKTKNIPYEIVDRF